MNEEWWYENNEKKNESRYHTSTRLVPLKSSLPVFRKIQPLEKG
jgi:hypothetical protein